MGPLFLAALVTTILPVQPSQPNRQPQLASATGMTVVAFGSGNSIWLAASHDDGGSFGPPMEVAHGAVLALGRHRGPRVVISGKAIIVSAVLGGTIGDLAAWRSTDGGRSWSKPMVINDVAGSAREGLHAMAAGSHGEIAAAWLDLRSAGTKLYGAYSKDDGLTWSRNVLLYEAPEGTICQCCDPSIVSVGEHQFDLMFRNVLAGARDMYLANWDVKGQVAKPQKLGKGSWNLNACPMDGGGLARRGNLVVSAWRRDQTVYLGEPGQAEMAVGEGKDVAVALSPKGPYVAWVSTSGIQVYCSATRAVSCLSATGSFPVLTSLSNGAVMAAWEQDGQIHFRKVD